MPDASLLILAGLACGALALLVRRQSRRSEAARQEMLRTLGLAPEEEPAAAPDGRVEFPPVDLSRPIAGEAAWRAIRNHAGDGPYLAAVETVRSRYQLVGNPMLLPNTLREVMGRSGLGFREAMLRVAKDDGPR